MAYQQPTVEYADPRTQAADNDQFESLGHKHREASTARRGSMMPEQNRYAPPQKPIDEAVTNAFDKAGLETSNYVPPELIAQITQNVIKQLQTGGGLDASTPVPSQHRFSPPPPPMHQPVPLSPSTASGTSTNMPNRVYTPPSPSKHSEYPSRASPQSQSAYLPDDLPSPRHDKAPHLIPRGSSSPHSQTSESSDKPPVRPRGPARLSTSKAETTLEKIWGQLFDEDGHPTKRLGQFLRGLAVHIVRLIQWVMPLRDTRHLLTACYRLKIMSPNIALSLRLRRWYNTTMTSSCQTSCIRGRVRLTSAIAGSVG